ncbi:MAG: precorrin-2 dehydrogenase/sirohydrochlorin ferrochelatase family protein, partial [Dissulfurimicrobium sp.]
GIFCNTVDQPDLCSFIVPAVTRRGGLCLAVSTSGNSPALAKRIKEELEASIGQIFGTYTAMLGEIRDWLLSTRQDPVERKILCQSLAENKILTWMKNGEWDKIEDWAVTNYGEGAGEVVRRYRPSTKSL